MQLSNTREESSITASGHTRRRAFHFGTAARVATVVVGVSLVVGGLAEAAAPPRATPSVYVAIAPRTVLKAHTESPGEHLLVAVSGRSGLAPKSATAVQLTVAVSDGSTEGRLDVYPAKGGPVPAVRWARHEGVTTTVTVPVGAGGKIVARNRTGKVTVTLTMTAYYTGSLGPNSVKAGNLSTAGAKGGQVLTATGSGVKWASPQVTYTTTPTSAQWLWNSGYSFSTSPGGYTEYFTRYVNVATPALTPAVLAKGSVQVYFIPDTLAGTATAWQPLPFQFTDFSDSFNYNIVYSTSAGQVQLGFYLVPINAGVTLPTLSTYTISTYQFKIVVDPGSGTQPVSAGQPARSGPALSGRHPVCTAIPGGKRCVITGAKPRG